jgi:hypothetical protein
LSNITNMANQNNWNTNRAKEILNKHKQEFQKYNIIGSGIGFKTKPTNDEKQIAIIFYVRRKKNNQELLDENTEPIPQFIEEIPTEVIEMPNGFVKR